MKRSTIKALEDLKKKQDVEIEDLTEDYKKAFGEDSEEYKQYCELHKNDITIESEGLKNEYGRKAY